ncbi:MAG: sigma 54-interacting transcriptional regulator, partial [Candidatus Nanoarchaeia archaeon]
MKNKLAEILIADDERNTREAIAEFLRKDYDLTLAEDGLRAINILKKRTFDIVLTDLRMPGADGMQILQEVMKNSPKTKCIILTAYGSIDSAVKAVKEGAFDFLEKPLNLDILELTLKRALEAQRLEKENIELKKQLNSKTGATAIVGSSKQIHAMIETIKLVAPTKSTVLITGESGTGKELVAEHLHSLSGRSGPFIAVHCAALPSTLLESELFGHEKGAFTGATERRKGRFELADKGTLFL